LHGLCPGIVHSANASKAAQLEFFFIDRAESDQIAATLVEMVLRMRLSREFSGTAGSGRSTI
jgi:hypothetical protein